MDEGCLSYFEKQNEKKVYSLLKFLDKFATIRIKEFVEVLTNIFKVYF